MGRAKWFNENGFTLMEVIISISLISLLLVILLPYFVGSLQRVNSWNQENVMEQESIRFFTYLTNRNACLLNWTISNNGLIVTICNQNGNGIIQRKIYQDGNRVVEIDIKNGGFLILSHMVESIRFTSLDNYIEIKLSLMNGDISKTYLGVLVRGIEP